MALLYKVTIKRQALRFKLLRIKFTHFDSVGNLAKSIQASKTPLKFFIALKR